MWKKPNSSHPLSPLPQRSMISLISPNTGKWMSVLLRYILKVSLEGLFLRWFDHLKVKWTLFWLILNLCLCSCQAPSKLLKQPLSNLVEYLTEGLEDDLSKVRAIYRWVTCQPVDSMKIPNKEPSQSHTMFQLWRIKHRKGNYAQLISLLCRSVF